MTFKRDERIVKLRRCARLGNRELANFLNCTPNAVALKIGGFRSWKPGERERLVAWLSKRVAAIEEIDKT